MMGPMNNSINIARNESIFITSPNKNHSSTQIPILNKIVDKQFIIFLLACSMAACINFVSRIFIGFLIPYTYSIIIAYIFGMVSAYTLCRYFVFQVKKNNTLKQFGGFCLVNVFSI